MSYWKQKQNELKRKSRLMDIYVAGFLLIALVYCALCGNF